jgi:hypothetical protein
VRRLDDVTSFWNVFLRAKRMLLYQLMETSQPTSIFEDPKQLEPVLDPSLAAPSAFSAICTSTLIRPFAHGDSLPHLQKSSKSPLTAWGVGTLLLPLLVPSYEGPWPLGSVLASTRSIVYGSSSSSSWVGYASETNLTSSNSPSLFQNHSCISIYTKQIYTPIYTTRTRTNTNPYDTKANAAG